MKVKRLFPRLISIAVLLAAVQFVGAGFASAQQSSDTDIVELTRSLMSVTEDLRGLDFMYDLPVELVSQDEIKDIIAEQLAMEITPEKDRAFSALYTMLGLIPSGSSLMEDYQTMAEEQVAGLYDPHEKRFYVVDMDMGAALSGMFGDMGPIGSFLGGMMEGMSGDMSDTMTNTVIVHELTHALDDQHFDIESALEKLVDADSDDAQLAYQSLVEGNATRIMNEYAVESMGLDSETWATYSGLNSTLAEMMMDMSDYNAFLGRLMIVPYLKGEEFVNEVVARSGEAGLDRVFSDPPQSMEQVLHPEKYTIARDIPSYTNPSDLSRPLPGWKLEATDTLGELIIDLVFELPTGNKSLGERVAKGWDYDVVTSWRAPNNDLAFAWITVWDSESEASEFFGEYCSLLETKYPQGNWSRKEASYCLFTGSGLAAVMKKEGRVAVIVEGVPERNADACLNAAWPSNVTYR